VLFIPVYLVSFIFVEGKRSPSSTAHKEMSELTDYSINTIRSKASKGDPITTRDGLIYRYDKDPKVVKWVRV
jgi:putative ATP-binding cassette transporter